MGETCECGDIRYAIVTVSTPQGVVVRSEPLCKECLFAEFSSGTFLSEGDRHALDAAQEPLIKKGD